MAIALCCAAIINANCADWQIRSKKWYLNLIELYCWHIIYNTAILPNVFTYYRHIALTIYPKIYILYSHTSPCRHNLILLCIQLAPKATTKCGYKKKGGKLSFIHSFKAIIPAVFSNIIKVSKGRLCHLFTIVLKERHPPYSVPCHSTGLKTINATSLENTD